MATLLLIERENAPAGLEPMEFNLADFGGQLPGRGDIIFPPNGSAGAEAVVWEVVSRAFDPGRGFDAAGPVHILVRERKPTDLEARLRV